MRLKYGIAIAGMHGKTTTTSHGRHRARAPAGWIPPSSSAAASTRSAPTRAWAPRNTWLPKPTRAIVPFSSSRPSSPSSPISTASTWTATATWPTWSAPISLSWIRCPSTARSPPASTMPRCAAILPRVHRRVFTYGEARGRRLPPRVSRPRAPAASRTSRSAAHRHARAVRTARARPPQCAQCHRRGRHRASTWTSSRTKIAAGISSFRGVDRRFQIRGQARGVTVVDDYGHHPTEIRATLAAARECGYRPHSRRLPAPPLHPHPRPAGRVRRRVHRRRHRDGAAHLRGQRKAHPGHHRGIARLQHQGAAGHTMRPTSPRPSTT